MTFATSWRWRAAPPWTWAAIPWTFLRLLDAGTHVVGAEAKLSSPGIDRAMDANFSLPDSSRAHIGCSMFSSSILRLHAEVTGDDGKVSVFDPFRPSARRPR